MYQSPTIYDGTVRLSADEVRGENAGRLLVAYNEALDEMVAQANANEEYLDPNSVQVRITVSARAL